jgi:hypothetical protein
MRDFIVQKMSEGLTIAEIHKKYPLKCSAPNSVYRKSADDEEWAAALDQGYSLWHYAKLEELDRLSTGLASELYPGVDFREAEAALKRRIDTLKFSLGKMAPMMSKRWDKATKIEVDGVSTGPSINVINYYGPPEDEDGNIIEHDPK